MESKLERARKQEQRDFIVSRSDNEMPLWQRMAGCGFLSFTATFLGMSKRNQSMNAFRGVFFATVRRKNPPLKIIAGATLAGALFPLPGYLIQNVRGVDDSWNAAFTGFCVGGGLSAVFRTSLVTTLKHVTFFPILLFSVDYLRRMWQKNTYRADEIFQEKPNGPRNPF